MGSFLKSMRLYLSELVRSAKKQRLEILLFVFCNFLIVLTFSYGAVVLLPDVLGDRSWTIYLIHYIWTVFVVLCELCNYHLIRIRNSSIKNHILIPPPPPPIPAMHTTQEQEQQQQEYANGVNSSGDHEGDMRHRDSKSDLTTNLKNLAETFTPRPFNSDEMWHICGACETIVPPRSWHCNSCGTCIFRRDHHCVFAATCIGEDNQSNFLGFLFYLAAGSFYATVIFYIHMVHVQGISRWMWVVRCLFSVYTLFWEFNLGNVLATVTFAVCLATTSIFIYYIVLATRGQTSADSSKGISRHAPGEAKHSYKNVQNFLGPNPLLRILWPFHKVVPRSYEKPATTSTKDLSPTTENPHEREFELQV